MKSRLILLLTSLLVLSSCSKDDDDSAAKKLIIGKWVYQSLGTHPVHDFYLFHPNGTGVEGSYDTFGGMKPNPRIRPFRYAIRGNKIAFCFDQMHTHPIKPGENCPPDGVNFHQFKVNGTSFFRPMDWWDVVGDKIYMRVEKWSDAGLPDDLLPQ